MTKDIDEKMIEKVERAIEFEQRESQSAGLNKRIARAAIAASGLVEENERLVWAVDERLVASEDMGLELDQLNTTLSEALLNKEERIKQLEEGLGKIAGMGHVPARLCQEIADETLTKLNQHLDGDKTEKQLLKDTK